MRNKLPTVPPIRHSPALPDYPGVEVKIAPVADGDQPAVLISLATLAADGIATDSIRERHGGFLSASPGLPVAVAGLAALGRVDAV